MSESLTLCTLVRLKKIYKKKQKKQIPVPLLNSQGYQVYVLLQMNNKQNFISTCFVSPIQNTLRTSHSRGYFYMQIIDIYSLVFFRVISCVTALFVPFFDVKQISIQTLLGYRNVWSVMGTDSKLEKTLVMGGQLHCDWYVFCPCRVCFCNDSLGVQTPSLVFLSSQVGIPTDSAFPARFNQPL